MKIHKNNTPRSAVIMYRKIILHNIFFSTIYYDAVWPVYEWINEEMIERHILLRTFSLVTVADRVLFILKIVKTSNFFVKGFVLYLVIFYAGLKV